MANEFTHPLARAARIWRAVGDDGTERRILVVVTTMELDPKGRGYKKTMVDKLSRAAKEYLARSSGASDYVLMNRMKDWRA